MASSLSRWLARSFERKRLYHLSGWYSNWGWGPPGRSPSAAERLQGHFGQSKGHPITLIKTQWPYSDMQWVACSPHPSQPASTWTSGQVRRTIGIPADYWGSHQCGVANKHPWWSGLFSFLRSIQNLRLPSSFQDQDHHALSHGLCDFQMALISSISCRWAFSSSYTWGGICQ